MARSTSAGAARVAPPDPSPRPTLWTRFWHWFIGWPTEHEGSAPVRVELPWRYRWDHLPKRSAGFGFTRHDYRAARRRGELVARETLGEPLWRQAKRTGYLDVPSKLYPGVIYRLRVGRRIEVRCEPGVKSPWRYPYLCINPVYPLPEAEFFAQLYLYVRDQEAAVVRVAAPQPWDQTLGRTF